MNSALLEYKHIENPHHLQEREEAVDHLTEVFMSRGRCIAIFEFGAVSVAPELEQKLKTLIGHRCAILRLDGRYHVRNLDAEAENAA
jgi:hypothetical protein